MHGATPQRTPLADRPLKSRDRRAAHGNGTAFSAVAPSSGPHWPPVDPITREWYRPQARIDGRLTFQPAAQFRPSVASPRKRGAFATYRGVSPAAHLRICTCVMALELLLGQSAAIFRSSAKSGNAARGGADLYEAAAPSWGKSWFTGCARSALGSQRWLLALRGTRLAGT